MRRQTSTLPRPALRDAQAQGVRATSRVAFAGLTVDQNVLNFDRRQRGTFRKTFEEYVATRVGASRIKRGRDALARHAALLGRVEKQFGVPKELIVAIWGLESDFGTGDMGKLPVVRTIATMAHDCRRTELFQGELIAALKILQRGDLTRETMIGAYAGELGQTQFLPSSYIKYGVDYDGNGQHRPAPQRAGRARLHREPAQGQRLAGRRAVRRGHAELPGDARVEPQRGVSQDDALFRAAARRADKPPEAARFAVTELPAHGNVSMAKESFAMVSPFLIYFAGIGTVVAALGVGFGGGLFLTSTDPVKEGPRAKDRPEIVAKQDKPELPIATTPVTVRTPEENKAAAAARDTAKINEPKPAEPGPAKPESAAATDERAAPAAGWVAAPPPETTGSATTSAPALPVTAPLTPPAAHAGRSAAATRCAVRDRDDPPRSGRRGARHGQPRPARQREARRHQVHGTQIRRAQGRSQAARGRPTQARQAARRERGR